MGKIVETKINRWDGGMTNILRSKNTSFARFVKNFDLLSDPTRLAPYRDFTASIFESGLTAATIKLSKMLIAKNDGATSPLLYALGVNASDGFTQIFQRDLTPTDVWDIAGATHGTEVPDERCFVEYRGRLFGWSALGGASSKIWTQTINGQTFAESGGGTETQAIANVYEVSQGLVHSKDDILYMPYATFVSEVYTPIIATNNAGTWNTTALTLPRGYLISSMCEYGNYLAIALKPKFYGGKSFVLLWDRDSSVTTISEKIDFGYESLELIEEINGYLVGVSLLIDSSTTAITFSPKIVFKAWAGGSTTAKQFNEILLSSGSTANTAIGQDKQKINNRILFMLKCQIQGTQVDAVWSLGAKPDGTFAVSIDRLLNNDSAITTSQLKGFFKYGDYMVVNYSNNSTPYSGTYVSNITINSETFTATASFETIIFGESYQKFKLNSVGVMFEKLPTNGQVVLKYRIDGATSWTTIFTHTTDDSLFHEAINIEAGGALPEWREIEFQILSTGGAVITGFWAQAEEMKKGLVNRILAVISGWVG